MVFVIKPLNAQLAEDHDIFGGSVNSLLFLGSVLRNNNRGPSSKDKNWFWCRKTTCMARHTHTEYIWDNDESLGLWRRCRKRWFYWIDWNRFEKTGTKSKQELNLMDINFWKGNKTCRQSTTIDGIQWKWWVKTSCQ